MNPLFADLPTTIFTVMSDLAREHDAINLGQGFPDGPGPGDIRAEAARALIERSNQYPSMLGLPELRAAVAEHYGRLQGLSLDPATEVLITSGATEAIAASILSLVRPGDEVVMFQPLYDAYLPLVRYAGGIPRLIRLEPPQWAITEDALAEAFGPRTRLVILNNPVNPTAVVYGREQLALLADYCVRFDVVALCDEVWEHVVFAPHTHLPLMALPGMRDRTIKIGSAGKIFSLTGWKVGFIGAAAPLTAAAAKAHQFLAFTTPPNLQWAVAYGLGKDAAWFAAMREGFGRSRDRLAMGLSQTGFSVLPSQGTYFLNIDLAASGIEVDDATFSRRAVQDCGVASIPVSAFYAEDPVRSIVRLCFAKADAVLDEAVERLAKARRLFA